jgi:alkylhydroperoxidase family enzyme
MPEGLQDLLASRVERLGYLGGFFSLLGHQPGALAAFYEYTEALKAALPDDLTEVVALRTATLMANDYERVQHERLARKHGQSEDWIQAAEGGGGEELSPDQVLVHRLADRMVEDRGHGADAELRDVVAAIGQERGVAVLLLVGRYVAHAHIANALRLTPPERVR